MNRQPKSKLAVAITAALELEPNHPLFRDAKAIVEQACAGSNTSKGSREQLGQVAAATWTRWKRRCGLEVKVTNPGGSHVSQ
jgi:hypothetical protein